MFFTFTVASNVWQLYFVSFSTHTHTHTHTAGSSNIASMMSQWRHNYWFCSKTFAKVLFSPKKKKKKVPKMEISLVIFAYKRREWHCLCCKIVTFCILSAGYIYQKYYNTNLMVSFNIYTHFTNNCLNLKRERNNNAYRSLCCVYMRTNKAR